MTERQQLWTAHKEYVALNAQVEEKLFESGKLFGLQSTDPAFRKLLADISIALSGITVGLGSAGYNINLAAATARDNVLRNAKDAGSGRSGKRQSIKRSNHRRHCRHCRQWQLSGTASSG
jgi:hypothetical protein